MAPILYVLAPEIINVLLGSRWTGAVHIFSALGIAIYFRLGARVSGSLLRATGSVGQLVLNQTFYAVLTIGGSLFAVHFGVVAVGAAIALAIGLWFCLITVQACRKVDVSFRTFVAAHQPGLMLAVATTALVSSVTFPFRALGFSSIIILLTVGLVLSIIAFFLVILRPRRLLGNEGTELAAQVASFTATASRRLQLWETSRAV
jgi:PST family polysaccharide transporter